MKKKISVWCLLFITLLFSGMKESVVNIKAASLEKTQIVAENKVKGSAGRLYSKYVEVNTSGKSEKIVVTIPEYTKNKNVAIVLRNCYKNPISETINVTNSSQKVTFFVNGGSKYYVEISANDINLKYNISRTVQSASSGKSFSKAVTIKPGSAKGDVIGYNDSIEVKQYYKIKVNKEKLVKLKIKKSESSGLLDVMKVSVYYKSINEKNRVEMGYLYEGQKSACMLIRNNKKKKTKPEPGTYYIVVSKVYKDSGFQYSISY